MLLLNSWICAVCFYQLKKIDIFFNVKPINSRFSIDKFFKSHQLLRIPTPKLLLSFVHRQQLQNVSRIFDYSFLKIISCEKNSFFFHCCHNYNNSFTQMKIGIIARNFRITKFSRFCHSGQFVIIIILNQFVFLFSSLQYWKLYLAIQR